MDNVALHYIFSFTRHMKNDRRHFYVREFLVFAEMFFMFMRSL